MLRQCLLVQLLSARCCCVTAAKLALPALLGPQLPAVELQTQPGPALPGQALGSELVPLGPVPESQPERAASAIFRGLQPKNAPN